MLTFQAFEQVESIILWGLTATVVMTTIMLGSQGLGFSRLSLPFLVGTFFTGNRRWANIVGVGVYLIGGWFFTFFYYLIFIGVGQPTVWLGTATGLLHGLFLLVVLLPLLPQFHPRMATEYDGPTEHQRLEPPGFLGLNFGFRTPLVTLLGHVVFGAILGAAL
ncbi:MAG: hypothetical protein LJE85_01470 [Gammaproteobacteria bacterium]|jgi:hypothetical protein|nr:hypothetical protein [Gammaproteobacteria bacterium]